MSEVTQTPTPTPTPTFDQLFANFETALNTLFDQQGLAVSGSASELVAQLKVELLGESRQGPSGSLKTLGEIQDFVDDTNASTLTYIEQRLDALNETYATDSELADRVTAINAAFEAADDDVVALVSDRPTIAAVDRLIADAKAYSDQQIAAAVVGLTEGINRLAGNAG